MASTSEISLSLVGFLCLLLGGLTLFAGRLEGQEMSQEELRQALAGLQVKTEKAKAEGLATLYAEVPLTVGSKFVEQDWDDEGIAGKGRRGAARPPSNALHCP